MAAVTNGVVAPAEQAPVEQAPAVAEEVVDSFDNVPVEGAHWGSDRVFDVFFGDRVRGISKVALSDTVPLAWRVATESPAEVAMPARVNLNFLGLAMSGQLQSMLMPIHSGSIPRSSWIRAMNRLLALSRIRVGAKDDPDAL